MAARPTFSLVFLAGGLALATTLALAGCGHGHGADDGHSHEGSGKHVHADGTVHDDHEGHVHMPHYEGMLVPLGEDFANVEVRLDPDGTLNAWIWDGCAEHPIRISQTELRFDIEKEDGTRVPVALAAVAKELTGDTVGNTSEFQGHSPELAGLEHFTGTLASIELKGVKIDDVGFEYGVDHDDHDEDEDED